MRCWRSIYGAVVCARCHPPADVALVAGWEGEHEPAPAAVRRPTLALHDGALHVRRLAAVAWTRLLGPVPTPEGLKKRFLTSLLQKLTPTRPPAPPWAPGVAARSNRFLTGAPHAAASGWGLRSTTGPGWFP